MAVRFSSRDDKVDGKVQVDDHEAERKPLVGQKESVNSYYSTINEGRNSGSPQPGEDDWAKDEYRKLMGVCNKYEEANIYLIEGVNYEHLSYHPSDARKYRAYKVIHYPLYYVTEVLVCVLLMLLAFLEEPTFIDVPIELAPSLEILFMLFFTTDLIFRLQWRPFFYFHPRTLFKISVIVTMLCEAAVVLASGDNHFGVSRALRPLFLLDIVMLQDVRRILFQIIRCMGRIIDVLLFLFFFITIFAVSGFYLFNTDSPTNYQFDSFGESFINIYILSTSANFPDVMMESYNRKPLAPLFFVIFLIIAFYLVLNVLLGVVYSTFRYIQKKKFKRTYFRKRNALKHAFHVLAIDSEKSQQKVLKVEDFLQLMEYYSPFTSKLTCLCMFKAMIKGDRTANSLTLEEFYSFYDYERFAWNRVILLDKGLVKARWYHVMFSSSPKLEWLTEVVNSTYFTVVMNLAVLFNALFFFINLHKKDPEGEHEQDSYSLIVNFIFFTIYILEIVLKLVALGPVHFCRSYWNLFDFLVISVSFIIQSFEVFSTSLNFLIPLRFIRLIRFNSRTRAIINAVAMVTPRIINIAVLMMLIFYAFAIIGMECFHGKVFQHCCNSTTGVIGNYYTGQGSNLYYLNNFDSLSQSYVTLFELMVMNNWWIIMEGFHFAVGDKTARIFFIFFHIINVIVVTVAMAFIVEAFQFKLDLNRQEFTNTLDSPVEINKDEIEMIEGDFSRAYWPWQLPNAARKKMNEDDTLLFQGTKTYTKENINKELYEEDIKEWENTEPPRSRRPNFSFDRQSSFMVRNKAKFASLPDKASEMFKATLSYIFT